MPSQDGGPKLPAALAWNTGGLVFQAIAQLTFGLLLARILGPTPYGLMAMAWIALTPATILVDAGLGLALVQKPELTGAMIRYAFCVQSFLAFVIAIAFCAFAPLMALFFGAPELSGVLIVSSSILLVQAFGQSSVNLLRREMDFRRLQIVQLAALLGSTVLVALPLAIAGFGVWSLVLGALANVATISISATTLTSDEGGIPRRIILTVIALTIASATLLAWVGVNSWKIVGMCAINAGLVAIAIHKTINGSNLSELRRQGSFGNASARFLILNLVNATFGALPAIVIGRSYGVAAVGLFDRTFALIVAPIDRAAAAISGVLFSHHATLHRTGAAQNSVFLRSLTLAFLAGLPFAAGVVENEVLIIDVALGKEWLGAVPLVPPMAALVVLILVLQVAVPVLNGRGRPEIEAMIQLTSIVLFVVAVVLFAQISSGILWALVAAYVFRVLCVFAAVCYFLAIRPMSMFLSMLPGGVAAIFVFIANLLLSDNLPNSLSEAARLVAMIGTSAIILALAWLASETIRRRCFCRFYSAATKSPT